MGYYIRVLGLDTRSFTTEDLDEIKGIIMKNEGIDFDYQINGQNEDGSLKGFIIKNMKGEDIADVSIDRKQGNLLDEEIEEFKEDIKEYVSQKNYEWLGNYLDKVEIIYAFQVLNKGFEPKNWDIIYARTTLYGTAWAEYGRRMKASFQTRKARVLWRTGKPANGLTQKKRK